MKDLERNSTRQKIKCLRISSETNKRNQLFMNLEREGRWDKDLGGFVGNFSLFFINSYLYIFLYI